MRVDSPISLSLLLVSCLSILRCSNPGPDPCEDDTFGCADPTEGLEMDEACELDGELTVEVGWGLNRYHSFERPAETWQGFQGGEHTFLGIRVENAALDQYDKIEVTFEHVTIDADCVEDWSSVDLSADLLEECGNMYPMTRRVIFGELAPIRTDESGAMQEYGIFLEIPWETPTVVVARVLDPCGQTGFHAERFPGGE